MMFDHIRAFNNIYVSFYFVAVIVIGNFLLLNLFLAILINNFGESAEKIDNKNKNKLVNSSLRSSFKKKNAVFPERVRIF